jgi:hypothetical protein
MSENSGNPSFRNKFSLSLEPYRKAEAKAYPFSHHGLISLSITFLPFFSKTKKIRGSPAYGLRGWGSFTRIFLIMI